MADQTKKKNERAHAPTGTHVPNRNMLENTIFYLIRDDYIYICIYMYITYIYMFIQQYLYSNMYQTR